MYWYMFKQLYNNVCILPTSSSLSLFWNFGSLLGIFMVVQILTGFLMTFYYIASAEGAFFSVQYLMTEVNTGWVLRILHMNGSSIIFLFLYSHMFKGLFINSYKLKHVWLSGLLMFVVVMGVAFMGYSVVWSQMSYWAVVVITSLVSVVPYAGFDLLVWIWGSFSVSGGVLKLFFSIHFLLPFVLLILIMGHLLLLHTPGSSSSLSYMGDSVKMVFHPFYSSKDFFNFSWLIFLFGFFLLFPFVLGDCELFLESNNLVSPVHIAPEWYFCTFYAILRSIPDKVLGVVAMGVSLVELAALSLKGRPLCFVNKKSVGSTVTSTFLLVFLVLMWLGQGVAETPFVELSLILNFMYFLLIFTISLV